MITTVRHVTGKAVLVHRGMFEHKRPSLFRMAGVTEFVHRIRLDHLLSETTMSVVTIKAGHSTLSQRMM